MYVLRRKFQVGVHFVSKMSQIGEFQKISLFIEYKFTTTAMQNNVFGNQKRFSKQLITKLH